MNDLGKSIDSMVKETNPTGQIAKKPTDYKGVQTTPYGHVFNFNGGSITDKGAERASMKMPVEKGKNYGFTYTKGGDEVYADTFEEAYKGLGGVLEEPKPAAKDAKTELKEAEAYYKEAGDIIGKNAVANKDLLEGVDKARFEEAKKVLSRNARGLGNIESQYIDLMNKGWKQQDVEAELAKRGFSKDDIKNAYGEVRYGERYKDWKGNDNYKEESGGIKGDLEKAGFANVKVVDDKTLTFTGSDKKPWTIKQNESLGFDVYDSTGKKVVSDVNANRESIAEKISSLAKKYDPEISAALNDYEYAANGRTAGQYADFVAKQIGKPKEEVFMALQDDPYTKDIQENTPMNTIIDNWYKGAEAERVSKLK